MGNSRRSEEVDYCFAGLLLGGTYNWRRAVVLAPAASTAGV